MLETALRSRCEQRLAQLPLPEPFTVERFRRALAARRGRPLTICAMPSLEPGGPSGAWIATEEADYVFFDESARPLDRGHIVLHEFADINCDDGGAPAVSGEDVAALLPALDPEMVARVLGRSRYTQVEEHEAELLATLIAQAASRAGQQHENPEVLALRGRLRSTLG